MFSNNINMGFTEAHETGLQKREGVAGAQLSGCTRGSRCDGTPGRLPYLSKGRHRG